MSNKFKIQIPNAIIRNPSIDDRSFYVYCKLVQRYYNFYGKSHLIEFDHKKFMYHANINDNRTLKKCFAVLYQQKLIKSEVNTLPKNKTLQINLNTFFDKKKEKNKEYKYFFAQLPVELFDYRIVNLIGHTGIRLMYYYQSYMGGGNTHDKFCFTAIDTIAKETGITRNTIIKYNEILRKNKLVRIEKHELEPTYSYVGNEFGNQILFTKYNNHYKIDVFSIENLYNKLKKSDVLI